MKCECDQSTGKRYRYTVNVQTLTGSAGADGHIDETVAGNWTTSNTIKVNFVSKGGREFQSGKQTHANVSHTMETPSTGFSRTITPKMRMTWTDPDGTAHTFGVVAAYDVDNMQQVVMIHAMEEK